MYKWQDNYPKSHDPGKKGSHFNGLLLAFILIHTETIPFVSYLVSLRRESRKSAETAHFTELKSS